jgi:predicted AlkP superfamily pyrophosphatase or phosphodiesterase
MSVLKRPLIFGGIILAAGFAIWAISPPRKPSAPNGASQQQPPPPNNDPGKPDIPPGPPRLAVLLIFDQLRGDYPQRWGELFEQGGFRRFTDEGAWFKECHYPYAATFTGPGHATVATGASPDRHGIVGNNWYDRDRKTNVYCGSTEHGYQRVPAAAVRSDGKAPSPPGCSPLRLRSPTLADVFRQRGGRVVSMSMKDRGAILPCGGSTLDGSRPTDRLPNTACYWFDTDDGMFVTSTFYRDAPHGWADAFNQRRPADAWFHATWDRLHPAALYDRYAGPDDADGEPKKDRVFPHRLDGGLQQPGDKYYKALYASPFGNDLLLDFALAAVEGEQLGSRDVPDLLCVSFSCNDTVGHAWGPDSHEVLDCTLRTDLLLKRLFQELDSRVGKGRYVVVLSADHGVCPLPQTARAQGWEARHLDAGLLEKKAEEYLQAAFPGPDAGLALEATGKEFGRIQYLINDSFYLRNDWLKARRVPRDRAEELLADWARSRPEVAGAWTRTHLLSEPPTDVIGQHVRRSFHPERSGDVMLVFKPYHFVWSLTEGTTHGSPYPYDTHVPLMVYGPKAEPGVRYDAVSPEACAVILTQAFGLSPPRDAAVGVPPKLFKE